MEKYLTLILGLFLGLVSSLFIRRIERIEKVNDFIRGLKTELQEILPSLISIEFACRNFSGDLTRQSLQWNKKMFLKIPNNFLPDDVMNSLNNLLELPEEEIIATFQKGEIDSSTGLGLKKIHLIYIDNNLNMVSLLESRLQRSIFKIQSNKLIINQEIDRYFFYFDKTYSSDMSKNNIVKLKENMKLSCRIIYKFSYDMANEIDTLLPLLGKRHLCFNFKRYF